MKRSNPGTPRQRRRSPPEAGLTRKQLQADLDAARKREEILRQENERYHVQVQDLMHANKYVQEERDDWRFAFRTICKLAAR